MVVVVKRMEWVYEWLVVVVVVVMVVVVNGGQQKGKETKEME